MTHHYCHYCVARQPIVEYGEREIVHHNRTRHNQAGGFSVHQRVELGCGHTDIITTRIRGDADPARLKGLALESRELRRRARGCGA